MKPIVKNEIILFGRNFILFLMNTVFFLGEREIFFDPIFFEKIIFLYVNLFYNNLNFPKPL